MESLFLAPVNTTFPEAKIKADFTCSICLQTTPGKFSFRTTFRSSQSFPISILQPRSALATMLVTRKSTIFSLVESDFCISLIDLLAACSASDSDSEPMMIILPDLKTKIVLLGLVFLMITAGNLFLLYRHPSTFQAIDFKSKSFSIFILAKDTTFCTKGRFICSPFFYIQKHKINFLSLLRGITSFFQQGTYGWKFVTPSLPKDSAQIKTRTIFRDLIVLSWSILTQEIPLFHFLLSKIHLLKEKKRIFRGILWIFVNKVSHFLPITQTAM